MTHLEIDIVQVYAWLQWLAGLSLVTFLLSLLLIPLLVSGLPHDFFHPSRTANHADSKQATFLSLLLWLLRNVIGLILFFAGIAMLFLPGQGLLTIIIALTVMSFPYKQHLIHGLTRRAAIQRSLNWIRRKTNRELFIWS